MSHNPLATELVAARAVLRAAWDAVPEGRTGVSPSQGGWSAHLVLSHLARTGAQATRLAGRLWDSRTGRVPPAPPGLDVAAKLDALEVENRSRRVTAPDFAEPSDDRSPDELWARLNRSLRRLTELSEACPHLDVSGLTAPHPFLGPLDLHQWILFVAKHERRHAAQIDEISEALRR